MIRSNARRFEIHYTHLETQIGRLLVAYDDSNLTGLYFENHAGGPPPAVVARALSMKDLVRSARSPLLQALDRQLDEYFQGKRTSFDIALHTDGTSFQELVWKALMDIPYGEVITYSQLAGRIGKASAVRAVGTASSRNPISILIPCHRVVGAGGRLTGYAGGLDRKRQLLEIERPTKLPTISSTHPRPM